MPPQPQEIIDDPVLGRLQWSKDDEGWTGEYRGFKISFSQKNESVPTEALIKYARQVLDTEGFLTESLEKAKQEWIMKLPKHAKEISALYFDEVHFYRSKGQKNCILAHLGPEDDYKSWRIEYMEMNCLGLGCDT